jgi:uncharacterized protein (DUF305 family)
MMRFRVAVALGVTIVVLVAVSGVLVGRSLGDDSGAASASSADPHRPPGEHSVDVGFARDMGTHHAQAVVLADMVRDRTFDQGIRNMAGDISATQQGQIGEMQGWLDVWGRPPSSVEPPMRWMAHEGADAKSHGRGAGAVTATTMPGMASPAEVGKLKAAFGKRAEILFLTYMIRHHEGGIEMARYAAVNAQEPYVRSLARGMVDAQTAEIRTMRDLLAQRGVRYRG